MHFISDPNTEPVRRSANLFEGQPKAEGPRAHCWLGGDGKWELGLSPLGSLGSLRGTRLICLVSGVVAGSRCICLPAGPLALFFRSEITLCKLSEMLRAWYGAQALYSLCCIGVLVAHRLDLEQSLPANKKKDGQPR